MAVDPNATARWLLRSAIVLRDGPHRGAVAGWLDAHGAPAFAYPEITGYYLSWLASLPDDTGTPGEVLSAGRAAAGWALRLASGAVPLQTRFHLDATAADWRNDALFTFDLAMLARGLADFGRMSGETPASLPVLLERLSTACAPGLPLPVCFDRRNALPSRWSTREGPFQLKTAAAILFGVEHAPQDLQAAAWST